MKMYFGLDDYGYVIRASCGPQTSNYACRSRDAKIVSNVEISICISETEAKGVTYFDWEAWRNAFYRRLEGCRRWKQGLKMPTVSLIEPTRHIGSGIRQISGCESTANLQSSAGAVIRVWDGWVPHCVSICMYEMATEGFIVQPREGEGVELYFASWLLTFSPVIWERKTYSEASAISLKNAALLAQELLTVSSHDTDNGDTVDQCIGGVQSSREWAENLLKEDSEGNTGLALFLLKDAAIHARDIDALAMAIRVIICNRGEQGSGEYPAVHRALALLEKFYTCTNECAGPTGKTTHNMSMLLANTKYVRTVTVLFEEILKASKYYNVVVEGYQIFIVILMCYVGHGAHGEANFDILHSLLFKFSSDEVAESVALIVSMFSADQSYRTDFFPGSISNSAFLSLKVWVTEAIRIIAEQVDGAMALEELGVNPQRAIDILTKSIHHG